MEFPIGLVLEGMLAFLLLLTIVYCFVLDRKLRALRSGRDGLRQLIEGLDAATIRAQKAIAELKRASEEAGHTLGATVATARTLADELALMVESGNNIAARLEGGAHAALDSVKAKSRGSGGGDSALMKTLRNTR